MSGHRVPESRDQQSDDLGLTSEMADSTKRYLEGLAALQQPKGDKSVHLTAEAALQGLL